MKTVGADHEVKTPGLRVLKSHLHVVGSLANSRDAIAKDRFAISFDLAVDIPGEIAAGDRHVSVVSSLAENVDVEASGALSFPVDDSQFFDAVTVALDLG